MKCGMIVLLLLVVVLGQAVFACQQHNMSLQRRIACLLRKYKNMLYLLQNLEDTLIYNYRDQTAQSYCASKRQGEHVFAVRRDCANPAAGSAPTCNDLCGAGSVFNGNLTAHLPSLAGATECFDALWFWTGHPRLAPNPTHLQPDAGEINMGTYSYGSGGCTWRVDHCGPNYCCCSTGP